MSTPGSGRLQRIPKPLRPLVQAVVDPLRRGPRRLADALFRLHPRRIVATLRYFRDLRAETARRAAQGGLTVGVDIRPLWGSLTGIGWYLHRLLRELAETPGLRLRLYGPQVVLPPDFAPPKAAPVPRGTALEWVRYDIPHDLALSPHLLFRLLRRYEQRLVRADRNQVLFAPNFYLPEHFALAEGRLVATIHDLTLWRFPWTMDEANRVEQERHLQRTLATATHLITDAEAVRRELIEGGHAAAEKVTAIHLGPGQIVEPSSEAVASEGVGALPRRFALHVGTFEPRKNLQTLIAAWSKLPEEEQQQMPLVLCGERGWKNEALQERLARGVHEGWLVRLGYVSEAVLAELYRRAGLVVLASLYEGFGLPLVEAMTAGRPLLLSDIPVFREVAGDAARYVPAEDVAAWTAGIAHLIAHPEECQQLGEAGLQRAQQFRWSETAGATLEVWRQALSGPSAG